MILSRLLHVLNIMNSLVAKITCNAIK